MAPGCGHGVEGGPRRCEHMYPACLGRWHQLHYSLALAGTTASGWCRNAADGFLPVIMSARVATVELAAAHRVVNVATLNVGAARAGESGDVGV